MGLGRLIFLKTFHFPLSTHIHLLLSYLHCSSSGKVTCHCIFNSKCRSFLVTGTCQSIQLNVLPSIRRYPALWGTTARQKICLLNKDSPQISISLDLQYGHLLSMCYQMTDNITDCQDFHSQHLYRPYSLSLPYHRQDQIPLLPQTSQRQLQSRVPILAESSSYHRVTTASHL
jgi:hypothetical protein